jgi:hypothetical protein
MGTPKYDQAESPESFSRGQNQTLYAVLLHRELLGVEL